jgi:hypothetical protein
MNNVATKVAHLNAVNDIVQPSVANKDRAAIIRDRSYLNKCSLVAAVVKDISRFNSREDGPDVVNCQISPTKPVPAM